VNIFVLESSEQETHGEQQIGDDSESLQQVSFLLWILLSITLQKGVIKNEI